MNTFSEVNKNGGKGVRLEGAKIPSIETITATSGAISVSKELTKIDTTAGAGAYTLADGIADGQKKEIRLSVDGGNAVVTVASLSGGNTLTFADVNDAVFLTWDALLDSGNGFWVIDLNVGAVGVTTV
jgi:hypothetical protein